MGIPNYSFVMRASMAVQMCPVYHVERLLCERRTSLGVMYLIHLRNVSLLSSRGVIIIPPKCRTVTWTSEMDPKGVLIS